MLGFSFRKFRVHLIVATLIAALASFLVPTDAKEIAKDPKPVSYKYDLVIYGGTPSGVMAALAAKRMGLRVVLIHRLKLLVGQCLMV
ncbi:MAG: FAD-dependent oxidoreductase [Micrococcales bacterium]|nr:FAD-dependent oxidoreductase [Micrococcales bacterium]